MTTGLKYNNLAIIDGESYQDKYGLTLAQAANLSVLLLSDDHATDKGERCLVWYYGTAAIATTLTAMINFPIGTIVTDQQAHTTVEKVAVRGTSTWVTSAARA